MGKMFDVEIYETGKKVSLSDGFESILSTRQDHYQ